jgi:ferric-dicitrate binding protein FerR (iron transport regulator)
MRLACLDVGRLLDRRSSGLSAAEGLRLEEHLATCAACRADATLLVGLADLAATAPVGLSAAARERAIANALSANARPHLPRAVPPRVGMMLLAAAAALVIGFVAVQRASREELASSERVLSGRVEVAGSARSAGAALGSDVQLHAHEAAVVALAHARVELRAGSHARWDGAARKLELQRGSAVFEVDPAPHQSFTVQTKAFTVRVLGTRFEVTQHSVVVLSGRVSVQPAVADPNTAAIVLTAGSEQTRFEASSSTTEQAHIESQPTAADTTPPPTSGADDALRNRSPATRRKSNERTDVGALLDRARSELAARDLAQARATLELAKPLLRDAPLRAQALSLEAECELQAHRYGAARDTYLRVARTFPGMPAAETALFAAARIEAEHGAPERAAELFGNYLSKHPQGSYVREAERRLQLLPKQASP